MQLTLIKQISKNYSRHPLQKAQTQFCVVAAGTVLIGCLSSAASWHGLLREQGNTDHFYTRTELYLYTLRLQGCPRAGEAITDRGRGWTLNLASEAPLWTHRTLDKGAQHEEMGGSLLNFTSQRNESQAPSKSTAKVPFLLQGFLLQAVKTRMKDKF